MKLNLMVNCHSSEGSYSHIAAKAAIFPLFTAQCCQHRCAGKLKLPFFSTFPPFNVINAQIYQRIVKF